MNVRLFQKQRERTFLQNRLTVVAQPAMGSLPLSACSVKLFLHDLDFEHVCTHIWLYRLVYVAMNQYDDDTDFGIEAREVVLLLPFSMT